MPLDPYFQEMYLARRRDMIAQTRAQIAEILFGWLPSRRESEAPGAPTAVASGISLSTAKKVTKPALSDAEKKRAEAAKRKTPTWQRRNAKNWDTRLFGRVGTPGPDVPFTDYTVPVDVYPDVRVRVYRPLDSNTADTAASAIPTTPLPAVLAFFGGSFQLGGVEYTSVDAAFKARTQDAGVITVAVEYALAPEHRYPTQIEQGYAALDWIFENAESLGIDPERVAINGTSSGGNIAASVTLLNRGRAKHPLRLQLLEVPALDLTGNHVDMAPLREMRIPFFLARWELTKVPKAYLGDRSIAKHPTASPLRAKHHRELPPAHILISEYDVLRGDGRAYGHALRKSGIAASVVEYKGATHEAAMYRKVVPLAERWHRDAVAALRTLHE